MREHYSFGVSWPKRDLLVQILRGTFTRRSDTMDRSELHLLLPLRQLDRRVGPCNHLDYSALRILALFGRGCLFLSRFMRYFDSCSLMRPWILRVAALPNVSTLLCGMRRASVEGAVKVFSNLLSDRLLMVACLLGVELLAEGLHFFDSHHSLACTVGSELPPGHGGLALPWRLSLGCRLRLVNSERGWFGNLRLCLGLGGSDGSFIILNLYYLAPLRILFAPCEPVNDAK